MGEIEEMEATAWSRERGQALPLVALLLWMVAGVAVTVAMLGGRAAELARTQAGADAVALAVAGGGDGHRVAAANGVVIDELMRSADTDVVVRRGPVRAAARARTTTDATTGLHPALQLAIRHAEAILGERIVIVSGLRSRQDQERLWASRSTNRYPVARPGTSLHERGLAIDVPVDQAVRLARISGLTGLCQPLPLLDPVHFTLCRTTPTR